MRGDNCTAHSVWAATVHPHMRGDNCRSSNLARPLRFTPTCVGTIPAALGADSNGGSPPHAWGQCCQSVQTLGRPAVHPHMRGDNRIRAKLTPDSSVHPHMRGDNPLELTLADRHAVHPHMRGDNVRLPIGQCGCSVHPHMRGDNSTDHSGASLSRFTPTCVGKCVTSLSLSCPGTPQVSVHPHMRGDDAASNAVGH